MKRFLGIMAVTVLLCSILTGCGSVSNSTSPSAYDTLPGASYAPTPGAHIPVSAIPPYSESITPTRLNLRAWWKLWHKKAARTETFEKKSAGLSG